MSMRRLRTTARRQRAMCSMLLAIGLALSGCGTPGDKLPAVPPAASGEYHLGPGDQIKITTFGEQQLTGEFRVGDTGTLALPLIGDVRAAGKTPAELAAAIARTLADSKLYVDPKVTAEVTTYRPIFILGEVARPGEYPFQPGMTVLTAVAVGGGFTYRAITTQFSIVRTTEGKPAEGRAGRETPVQPGDVITVYERIF